MAVSGEHSAVYSDGRTVTNCTCPDGALPLHLRRCPPDRPMPRARLLGASWWRRLLAWLRYRPLRALPPAPTLSDRSWTRDPAEHDDLLAAALGVTAATCPCSSCEARRLMPPVTVDATRPCGAITAASIANDAIDAMLRSHTASEVRADQARRGRDRNAQRRRRP